MPICGGMNAAHMNAARISAGGFGRDERLVRSRFWGKLQRVAALIPFAPDLLAAYYCAVDRRTPHHVRIALFGALAYFIMPFDGVPDIVPMLGFADDAAMLAAAVRLVAGHITTAHRARAQEALERVTRFVGG
jgi:uncharacterized membrane protein YkvA (DUF1232 family)